MKKSVLSISGNDTATPRLSSQTMERKLVLLVLKQSFKPLPQIDCPGLGSLGASKTQGVELGGKPVPTPAPQVGPSP